MTRQRPNGNATLFHREYGGWRVTANPPHNRTPTSRAAANSMRAFAPTIRRRILAWLVEQGTAGGTAEQAQTALALRPSTAAARFTDLAQAGLIRDSGRTRPTTSGRQAVVWVASGSGADNG